MIAEHFPGFTGDSLTLAVDSDTALDDPVVRERVQRFVEMLAATGHVTRVSSPYDLG